MIMMHTLNLLHKKQFLKWEVFKGQPVRRLLFLSATTFLLLGLGGCIKRRTQARSLINLKLGMTKEEVVNTLGYYPDVHRGSIQNKWGQIVDVWEYSVASGGLDITNPQHVVVGTFLTCVTFGCILPVLILNEGVIEYYWMFFHNNILVQWGKAGDWDTANRQIYEIRFR